TGDHLGLGGLDSIGQLANVKGVVVDAVPRSGTAVLNADDSHVYRMGRHCAGRVVLFGMSMTKGEDGYDRVDGHTSRGGAAFRLEQTDEGELIVLKLGSRTMPVLYTHLVPATFGGRARMNVANALAASAGAWAAGAHLHDIRQGLRTFSTSFFQAPGRCNVFDEHPFRVIVDYGHNAAAVGQMVELVKSLRKRRAIGVLQAAGDRRDEDILAIGRIAASAFDVVIAKEDDSRRGRAEGAVASLLAAGAREGGLSPESVLQITNEPDAVLRSLSVAEAEDLVVIF
ncbi:MAG: cyanophycin synthetase, partial [Chloroflexota bacterium]